MPTLYVENVPSDLYDALRKRARQKRKSITAEVLDLLQANIPTEQELKRRRQFVRQLARLRSTKSQATGTFPSSEAMVREDRER